MHTAAGQGDSRRVTSLAGYGVDVNCQNIVGDTPLHWAVRNRRLGTSTRLLELGADVGRSNDEGVTVRKDVLVYMDLLQQECIKRKLVELVCCVNAALRRRACVAIKDTGRIFAQCVLGALLRTSMHFR